MSADNEQIRADIDKALNRLSALRDEARVKIHLGSMDARDAWERLQPKLAEAERAAGEASTAALALVEATVKKLSDLVGAL
ncbi:MAG: hypothetical protein ACLQVI_40040 [Polyangiaceae bacterium]|jgi:hypothetical protein